MAGYIPLFFHSTLSLSLNVAYGKGLGRTSALPP